MIRNSMINSLEVTIEQTRLFRSQQFFSNHKNFLYSALKSYGVDTTQSYLISFNDYYEDDFNMLVLNKDCILFEFSINFTLKPIEIACMSLSIDDFFMKIRPADRRNYFYNVSFFLFNEEFPNKIKNPITLNWLKNFFNEEEEREVRSFVRSFIDKQ